MGAGSRILQLSFMRVSMVLVVVVSLLVHTREVDCFHPIHIYSNIMRHMLDSSSWKKYGLTSLYVSPKEKGKHRSSPDIEYEKVNQPHHRRIQDTKITAKSSYTDKHKADVENPVFDILENKLSYYNDIDYYGNKIEEAHRFFENTPHYDNRLVDGYWPAEKEVYFDDEPEEEMRPHGQVPYYHHVKEEMRQHSQIPYHDHDDKEEMRQHGQVAQYDHGGKEEMSLHDQEPRHHQAKYIPSFGKSIGGSAVVTEVKSSAPGLYVDNAPSLSLCPATTVMVENTVFRKQGKMMVQ